MWPGTAGSRWPKRPDCSVEVVEATTGPTPAQTRKAMACFGDLGVTDRDARLALTSQHVGREVSSWNDLTKEEAATVIDRLEAEAQASRPADNDEGLPGLPGDNE